MNDKTNTEAEGQAAAAAPEASSPEAVPDTSSEATAAAFEPSDLVKPLAQPKLAPESAPPTAITVEVDEATKTLLNQQFVTLSSAVLDAADVASQAAKAANEAGQKFNHSSARLSKLSQGMGKTSTVVLVSTATLMLISIGFFAAMGIRLISKVNQLDATVMTVGKRAVEDRKSVV
jgi:hypothetical protein